MKIDFTAYGDDAVVVGSLPLETDRLTDLLTSRDDLELRDVTLQALEDGRVVTAPSFVLSAKDIVAAVATGPRGNAARRIRTRPHPVRAQLGPYTVVGYLHAPPTADPLSTAIRRNVVPVTSGTISYAMGDNKVEESCDAILLNVRRVDWLEPASDDDLRLPERSKLATKLDPRAKDMTGEVRVAGRSDW